MTPAEFEQLLRPQPLEFMFLHSDGVRLATAVAGLSEAERKRLSKTARDYYRKVHAGPGFSNDREFAVLGVLAVGSLSDARKAWVGFFQRQEDAAIKILIDRKPKWIDDWVNHKLSESYPSISWTLLRALIRAGICRKPDHRGYAQLMAMGLASRRIGEQHVPITQRLQSEPELLNDVWRFFEQDICPFHKGSLWIGALRELAASGTLDGQRLLDSALDCLRHDVSSDLQTGYIRFYRGLEPSPQDRAARQPVYLQLLAHRESRVVSFALEELAQLEKQDALDGEAFLSSGRSVFALKPKGQAQRALRLTASIARRQPRLVSAAINYVIEALAHDSVDVQQQALKLLEGWQGRLHRDHVSEIRDRLSGLSATTRQSAELLIESGTNAKQSARTDGCGELEHLLDLQAIGDRATRLAARWRDLAGIDQALDAAANGRLPEPLSFDLMEVPMLSSIDRVVPIQSVDELLDAVARALEVLNSADELERILDGISRLGDHKPTGFELRAAPLIRRMQSDPGQDAFHGLRNAYFIPESVNRLVLHWLSGQRCAWRVEVQEDLVLCGYPDIRSFIDKRVGEIDARLGAARSAPLLAAPTHRYGWIEPCEFVRRLEEHCEFGEVPAADLIQALLRLAPDNRPRALEGAGQLPGVIGRAVRWALGGERQPAADDEQWFPAWLGAGRARDPQGILNDLATIVPVNEATYALLPPTYDWIPKNDAPSPFVYRPKGAVDLKVTAHPQNIPSAALYLRPTLALYEPVKRQPWGMHAPWVPQWLASMWPQNADPHLAAAAEALCRRVNAPASTLEPNCVYLTPLLEPDRPWSELAYLDLWIALVSNDADSRGLAVDAMVLAIEDGRAAWKVAADVLVRLLPGGWVKLNRVASVFHEIARVSSLHAWWTTELLQDLLIRLEEFPRDVHHLLSTLVELLCELQRPLAPRMFERLSTFKLGGKTSQLIGKLLQLKFSGTSEQGIAALKRALTARFERATRWDQSHQHSGPFSHDSDDRRRRLG